MLFPHQSAIFPGFDLRRSDEERINSLLFGEQCGGFTSKTKKRLRQVQKNRNRYIGPYKGTEIQRGWFRGSVCIKPTKRGKARKKT